MNFGLGVVGLTRHRGYAHYNTSTINAGQITGTLTNFPMLVYGTFSQLATVANGGKVQNANGYDIIFSSNTKSDGSGILPFEIISWNATSGAFAAYVQVPSAAVGTQIYLLYGNSTVSTDKSNVAGVWSNGYVAVWHFGSRNGSLTSDSCGNAPLISSSGVSQSSLAGSIGGFAMNFGNNAANYAASAALAALATPNVTLECWTYLNAVSSSSNGQWFLGATTTSGNYPGCYVRQGTTTTVDWVGQGTSGNGGWRSDPGLLAATTWQQIVAVCSSPTTNNGGLGPNAAGATAYFNGVVPDVQDPFSNNSVGNIGGGNVLAFLGNLKGLISADDFALNGYLSECRISSVARTAAWVQATYNNQSAPGSFSTLS